MASSSVQLRCEGVRLESNGRSRIQVRDLVIEPGLTIVVGRNGAGKSSLLQLLSGHAPSHGNVEVRGEDGVIQGWPRPGDLTLVSDDAGAPAWWTVERCLAFASWLSASDTPAVSLETLVSELELGPLLSRRLRAVSAGEAQRVMLAMGLLQDSSVYLLDEPTASLDLALSPRLGRLINGVSRTRTVVVVTHDLGLLRSLEGRVLWLQDGTVHVDSHDLGDTDIDRLKANLDVMISGL